MLKFILKKIFIIFTSIIGLSCLLIQPDYEAPEVQILEIHRNGIDEPLGPSGGDVWEKIEIICTIEDNSSLEEAQLYVDNAAIQDDEAKILDFTSLQENYILKWNTSSYLDKDYSIQVYAYDKTGNVGKSNLISITVDNSESAPDTIFIDTIELEGNSYKITWFKSNAGDFARYEIKKITNYSNETSYIEHHLGERTDVDDTTYTVGNINPTIDHRYKIKVIDEFGFVNAGRTKLKEKDDDPNPVDLDEPIYENNTIILNWSKSLDHDFLKYRLFESLDSLMSDKVLIDDIYDADSTEFIINGITDNFTRYYRIDVFDIWEQEALGNIKSANEFIRFHKVFGGANNDVGYNVVALDGEDGFIVSGYTESFGLGDKDGFVMKLDYYTGNQLNKTTFGSSNLDVIRDATKLSDGSIIYVGRTETETSGTNGWIIHTDQNGFLINEKNIGGPGQDRFNSIYFEDQHEKLIVIGYKSITNGNVDDIDIWLVELDYQTLDTLKDRTFALYDDISNSDFDFGKDVFVTSSGDYYLLGETLTNNFSGGFDIFLKKYDVDLIPDSINIQLDGLQTSNNESAKKIILDTSGNGYYILTKQGGSTTKPVVVSRVNNDIIEWTIEHGHDSRDNGADIILDPINQGILVVVGTTFSDENDANLWFFKIDVNANQIIDEVIFDQGGDNEYGYGIAASADGGYILVGETNSYGSGGKDVLVIKTDQYGNSIDFKGE